MESITTYLPGLLLAFGVFSLNMISPGPNILAVIGTSMSAGRRSGLALAAGVAGGSFCWAALTAVGLSALLVTYANALLVIKIAGGCYLLWLAYKAFRASFSDVDPSFRALKGTTQTPSAFAVQGLIIQMTNPKAALAWVAIMSLGMQQDAPVWVALVLVFGLSGLSLLGHCFYAVAFSTEPVQRAYAKGRRWFQRILGAAFGYAGFSLLTSRT